MDAAGSTQALQTRERRQVPGQADLQAGEAPEIRRTGMEWENQGSNSPGEKECVTLGWSGTEKSHCAYEFFFFKKKANVI